MQFAVLLTVAFALLAFGAVVLLQGERIIITRRGRLVVGFSSMGAGLLFFITLIGPYIF